MSFATETKNELARIEPEKKCCMLAEIAGLIRMNGSLNLMGGGRFEIVITVDSPATARHLKKMLKSYFDIECSLEVEENAGINKGMSYMLIIGPEQLSEEILRETGILMLREGRNYITDGIYDGIIRTKCCRKAYLRGIFLAAGSVNDPENSYHFEISCSSSNLATDVRKLINTFTDINPKIVERKKTPAVYVKDSAQICDLLAIMGAHTQMLKYENVKLMKEIKNTSNRMANCDSANTDRIVNAAGKQIDDIEVIKQEKGLDYLPEKLRDIAVIRLENPEISLTELGEMLDPPMKRSGLSKRFKKISEIADRVRTESGRQQS